MKPKYLLFLVISFLLVSCSTNQCEISDSLLSSNAFPPGTSVTVSGPIEDLSLNSVLRTYYLPPNLDVKHTVSLHSSHWSAKGVFDEKAKTFFPSNKYWGHWTLPPEINYTSKKADQYYVSCGITKLGDYELNYCRMIARYGRYFSFLTARISEDAITLKTFQELLVEVDEKMIECLDNNQ